ncbi:MAG: FecR family protein [Halobacteriovoraceae bacterium]|nr:FecR family protein [Halobacteriovoraceae bacterium]
MKSLLIFTLLFFSSQVLSAGKLLHSIGKVTIDGKDVKKGATLPVKGKISTGPGSLAIIKFQGGSTAKLNENSSLFLRKDISKSKKTSLTLIKGTSFFKKLVKGKKKGGLNVKARNVSMGVRGTQFFVGFGQKKLKDVYMCVRKGEVLIKGEEQKRATLVKTGEGVVVPEGKRSTKPKPLPWTKDLNWNLDPEKEVVNKASIEESYEDPLEREYD